MKTVRLLAVLALVAAIGTGCIRISGSGSSGNDGGIFRSIDGGKSWVQKVSIPEVNGQVVKVAGANITKIVQDPSDRYALYLATEADGALYTYDGGERWQRIRQFSKGAVSDIAVDQGDKCTVYLAAANKIYKSDDCTRSWREVYFDTRTDTVITDVETESYNKNIVYAGNNKGDVLKSSNYGESWSVVKRTRASIRQILIDRNDTRAVYVGTSTAGIFKSADGGATWADDVKTADLNNELRKFNGALNFIRMAQDVTERDTLVLATKYGLLRTRDGGATFEDIKLLTPAGGATITSLAIDPKNGQTMYYGTNTTFYKTVNGGQNWTAAKLPTSRESSYIAIDPLDPNVLYLGTKLVKK